MRKQLALPAQGRARGLSRRAVLIALGVAAAAALPWREPGRWVLRAGDA